jgi:hypothetical protein
MCELTGLSLPCLRRGLINKSPVLKTIPFSQLIQTEPIGLLRLLWHHFRRHQLRTLGNSLSMSAFSENEERFATGRHEITTISALQK